MYAKGVIGFYGILRPKTISYLWRTAFHRWFGVCIVKSPAFGTGFNIEYAYVLSELTEHIDQEIKQDHHGMCRGFLEVLGVKDIDSIKPIIITEKYIDSFSNRFLGSSPSFEESLSALAGRELVAPHRNRLIADAFSKHYGISSQNLTFWGLHEELELDHFEGLWDAVIKDFHGDKGKLVQSAKTELQLHIKFWDDVSEYYLA